MKVVSNTSPLTNLAAIGLFECLRNLFDEIHIAAAVAEELNASGHHYPGSLEIDNAPWVHIHTVGEQPLVRTLRRDLDRGEAETIALALQLEADLVLIDEREGRHATQRLDLQPLGVLGVLIRTKHVGLVDTVRPHLDALRQNGFYITEPLYRRVLATVDE